MCVDFVAADALTHRPVTTARGAARTARRFDTARSGAVWPFRSRKSLRMLNAPTSLLASHAVRRSWWATLAALAAVRVAIPLVDWATGLPGVPRFHYHGLQG